MIPKTFREAASFSLKCQMKRAKEKNDTNQHHSLYEGTGNGQPLLANRVSWYFDLKGPSLALDTACSSSLVALHLACQSIRSGETTSVCETHVTLISVLTFIGRPLLAAPTLFSCPSWPWR